MASITNGTTTPPSARRLRSVIGGIVVCLALASVAGCGSGDDSAGDSGAEYAALGDSISAGSGIAPIADAGCQRSKVNYPSLVARRMGYSSFRDMTCGGATTTNLLRPQALGAETNEPQLDAVGTRTRLVTITIGLNDDQLTFALLGACLTTGDVPAVCRQLLDTPQSVFDQRLSAAAARVEKALELIRKRAPDARIILVGYPRYFPDSGSCPGRVPMVEQWVPRGAALLKQVDEKWKQAAAAAGADYVDTWQLSEGHDVCSADPWQNGSTPVPGEAVALHPFAAFHRAAADQIVDLLEKD